MPVYNAAPYLEAAVESILVQTLSEFELVTINDGSTDDSLAILHQLASNAPRIVLLTQPNRGIVTALNRGLDICRGEFIARMDADDISVPERLEKQVDYLNRHCEIDACGSWMESFSSSGKEVRKLECDDGRIRATLPFGSSFPHPSAMFRTSFFEGGLRYRAEFAHAEDYDLWARASATKRFHTLPEALYRYRIHENQGSNSPALRSFAAKVRRELLQRFGIDPIAESDLEIHESIVSCLPEDSIERLQASAKWLRKLRKANESQVVAPVDAFDEVIAEYWFRKCRASARMRVSAWLQYFRGPFNPIRQARLTARWALRHMRY